MTQLDLTTTLDASFLRVVVLKAGFTPKPMLAAQSVLLMIGLKAHEFTAADIPRDVTNGDKHVSGCASGSLVATGLLTVIRREKSPDPKAKGRKLDVFRLVNREKAKTWLKANGIELDASFEPQRDLSGFVNEDVAPQIRITEHGEPFGAAPMGKKIEHLPDCQTMAKHVATMNVLQNLPADTEDIQRGVIGQSFATPPCQPAVTALFHPMVIHEIEKNRMPPDKMSEHWPATYRGRIPVKVRMAKDLGPDMPFLCPDKPRIWVHKDDEVAVTCNPHGAMTLMTLHGGLGVKPHECDIIEWREARV